MAQKIVSKINWKNNTEPAINEDNLNRMDSELDQIDDRVLNLMGYEGRVQESVEAAQGFAEDSENSATLSRSWAIGGTGERVGEDTNNSNYWANKSKDYANASSNSAIKAENARDLAEQYKNQAFSSTPEGYEYLSARFEEVDEICVDRETSENTYTLQQVDLRYGKPLKYEKSVKSDDTILRYSLPFRINGLDDVKYEVSLTITVDSGQVIRDYFNEVYTGTVYTFNGLIKLDNNSKVRFYLDTNANAFSAEKTNGFPKITLFTTSVKSTIADKLESVESKIDSASDSQNVHFATGTEITVDTKKGGVRLEKIEGGMHKSVNLLDVNHPSVVNAYLKSDGSEVSNSYNDISHYIKVKGNTKYTIQRIYGSVSSYAWYDSSKNFLSGVEYQASSITNITVTSHSDASYLRVTVYHGNKDTMIVNEGETALPYEPYGLSVAGDKGYNKNWVIGSIGSADGIFVDGTTRIRLEYIPYN